MSKAKRVPRIGLKLPSSQRRPEDKEKNLKKQEPTRLGFRGGATPTRVSIVRMSYFQAQGEQPESVASRWTRLLDSSEPSYSKRINVGEEWTEIPHGHSASPSLVILQHTRAMQPSVIPTPEQKDEEAAKIIEVSFGGASAHCLIHPGEDLPFTPADIGSVRVRCQSGETDLKVIVYPS